MEKLNGYGFAVTENDLQLADETAQDAATVEYAPDNLDAALTVAAAVPGATLVPTGQLGSNVRLVLGESFDGTFSPVTAGQTVTGSVASTSGSVSGSADSDAVLRRIAGDQRRRRSLRLIPAGERAGGGRSSPVHSGHDRVPTAGSKLEQ